MGKKGAVLHVGNYHSHLGDPGFARPGEKETQPGRNLREKVSAANGGKFCSSKVMCRAALECTFLERKTVEFRLAFVVAVEIQKRRLHVFCFWGSFWLPKFLAKSVVSCCSWNWLDSLQAFTVVICSCSGASVYWIAQPLIGQWKPPMSTLRVCPVAPDLGIELASVNSPHQKETVVLCHPHWACWILLV